MQTIVEKGQNVVTLINVFRVAAERQAELVALLERATEEVMRHLPGFVSANIHRSLDGSRVANYAQWASRELFEAMLTDPQAQVHMRAANQLASFDGAMYELESVHR